MFDEKHEAPRHKGTHLFNDFVSLCLCDESGAG
jgi:hypothetical protein